MSDPATFEEATALITEFQADNDQARRIEIIFQLAANGSTPAQGKLHELYQTPPDPRLKLEVVNALSFLDPGNADFALDVLADAVKRQQSQELREAAVDVLRDLDDPRTIPIWRTLANDPDETIRETAADAIEYQSARHGLR